VLSAARPFGHRVSLVLLAFMIAGAFVAAKPMLVPGAESSVSAHAQCGNYHHQNWYTVEVRSIGWSVKGTYLVGRDGCNNTRLLSATCTKDVWWPYTVRVTWCGAFQYNTHAIDLGWNADVIAPGRTITCWARQWQAITHSTQPTRSGCG